LRGDAVYKHAEYRSRQPLNAMSATNPNTAVHDADLTELFRKC